MLAGIRSRLTYANVMATFAVFIVLGGGAYAAFRLPKDSVKSKHIVNGQVQREDLNADALDGSAVLTSRFHVHGNSFDQPTVFGPVSGMEDAAVPAVDGETESNFQMVSPGRDLVARDMVADFSDISGGGIGGGPARRLVLRVNGADTALQCEATGPGSCSPPAGTVVAIPAGSKLAWKTVASNTGGTVISASLILED